jgi:hypothetical protein
LTGKDKVGVIFLLPGTPIPSFSRQGERSTRNGDHNL